MIIRYNNFLTEELVGQNPITNTDSYLNGMRMGWVDKLFFMDQIDPDVIVDFGCADGFMLSKIHALNNNINLIGYDLDEDMINKASDTLVNKDRLTNNWDQVIEWLKPYKKPLLVLSSVIHEVYSYSHGKIVSKFWNQQVFGNHFKYVAIRDMIPSIKMEKYLHFSEDVEKIKSGSDPKILSEFEDHWGPIGRDYRNLIHYLLTYKYTDNWDRELKENYVPISLETFKKKIPSNWKINMEEDYIPHWIQNMVWEDFGVRIKFSTHVKIILENNGY